MTVAVANTRPQTRVPGRPRIERFRLPITNEEALRDFVWYTFRVRIPDTHVCAGHATPWEAFRDAYFARNSVTVWKASRGLGGKSYLLALLTLTEAITQKAQVTLLGGSGEQSRRVIEHMSAFWSCPNAPRGLMTGEVQREMRFIWGNTAQALMASQASTRGPHPQRVRLDEIDEMRLEILDAAMGQSMARPGIAAQTVLSSTHQHAKGTMTEILKRAGEKGWPVYEWCYKETSAGPNGWLDQAEIARKRNEVTKVMWDTEYELQAPNPESRAIMPAAVAACFKAELGQARGEPHEYVEIQGPVVKCTACKKDYSIDKMEAAGLDTGTCPGCGGPTREAEYVTGADWARKQDWTVIDTIRTDTQPARRVAWMRTGRQEWPRMVKLFDDRLKRYPGEGVFDGTGIGDVVAGYTESGAYPFIMAGRARSELLSNYISAIENGDLESPDIAYARTEHEFASVDDVYGEGHLPDSIAAGALAWLIAGQGSFVLGGGR